MRFDVVTLFPEMFRGLTDWGITNDCNERCRNGAPSSHPGPAGGGP